jgi:molecular chaperone DnaK
VTARPAGVDKATLLSATEAAARALGQQPAQVREESVATALDDGDLEDFSNANIPVPAPVLPVPVVPPPPASLLATAVMPSVSAGVGSDFGQVAPPPWSPPVPASVPPAAFGTVSDGTPHAVARPSARPLIREAPVLVDVTPLTLAVETVQGYCDPIITRNTPVPCERTREFVTAADHQTAVRVRISQGESGRFGDNTLLGELELSGLRSAPRGQVQISVTFALDTSGMLSVSARDVATGRATSAQVKLVGLPNPAEIASLSARHAAHPSE